MTTNNVAYWKTTPASAPAEPTVNVSLDSIELVLPVRRTPKAGKVVK